MSQNIVSENIFSTNGTSISQCDQTEQFLLQLGHETITFRLCELLSFKKKIQQIDLGQLLSSDTADIEVIYLAHCDRMIIVDVSQILELRSLFEGAFTMLELNSMLHRYIYRNPF